ncbi:MAG: hypothetical protein RIK87_27875 [Fuerstiella sp.]
MARKPVYGLHKATGQARTTFNGKRIYLGPHGTPQSRQKFDEILAKWEAARSGKAASVLTRLTVSRLSICFSNTPKRNTVRTAR